MNTRKIGVLIYGAAAIIIVAFTIYKLMAGKGIGFNEVIAVSIVLLALFSAATWGPKGDKDVIAPEDELGQQIIHKSAKASYFILTFCILGAIWLDQLVHGQVNPFLLGVLGLSIVIMPVVEFMNSRKYQ